MAPWTPTCDQGVLLASQRANRIVIVAYLKLASLHLASSFSQTKNLAIRDMDYNLQLSKLVISTCIDQCRLLSVANYLIIEYFADLFFISR